MARWSWRACNRFSWHDGDLELAAGGGLALAALSLWLLSSIAPAGQPLDNSIIVRGVLLLAPPLSFILLVVLRMRTIVPSGLWFFVGEPRRVSLEYVAPTALVFAGLGVYGIALGGVPGACISAGSLFALSCAAAWRRFGALRFFVLAVAGQVGAALLGARSGPETLIDAISLVSVALLLSGIYAFLMASRPARRGPQLNDIVRLLRSDVPEMRYLALAYAQNKLDPRLVGTLVRSTQDGETFLADLAQRALLRVWGPGADVQLSWYLEQQGIDPEKTFELAPAVLGEIMEINDRILAEMTSYQRAVEQSLRNALLSDPPIVDILIKLAVADGEGRVDGRVAALQLLGPTHSPRAYGALARCIVKRDPVVSKAAASGFEGASSAALEYLLPLLADPREWVRKRVLSGIFETLKVLSETDPLDYAAASALVAGPVEKLTRHRSAVTRSLALHTAMQLSDPKTSLMHELYRDPSALVRSEALFLLSAADSPEAPGYALESLGDTRACVRHAAVKVVFQRRVTAALPALIALQDDPSPSVVQISRDVIHALQGWVAADIEAERAKYQQG